MSCFFFLIIDFLFSLSLSHYVSNLNNLTDSYFIFSQFINLMVEDKNRKKRKISKIHCAWFKKEKEKKKRSNLYVYNIESTWVYGINPGRDVGSWFYLLKLVGYEPGYVSAQC